MTRTQGFLIAMVLAVAVVAGMFATLRTTQLGSVSTPRVSNAQVAQQTQVLNRAEAALRAQLKRKPPKVPALPSSSAPAAAPQTVIYQRPAPIVHVIHRHRGDDSTERSNGEGGGLDD